MKYLFLSRLAIENENGGKSVYLKLSGISVILMNQERIYMLYIGEVIKPHSILVLFQISRNLTS